VCREPWKQELYAWNDESRLLGGDLLVNCALNSQLSESKRAVKEIACLSHTSKRLVAVFRPK
jgi:hypothetical protein